MVAVRVRYGEYQSAYLPLYINLETMNKIFAIIRRKKVFIGRPICP